MRFRPGEEAKENIKYKRVISDILDPFKYEFNYGSNFIWTYLLSPDF